MKKLELSKTEKIGIRCKLLYQILSQCSKDVYNTIKSDKLSLFYLKQHEEAHIKLLKLHKNVVIYKYKDINLKLMLTDKEYKRLEKLYEKGGQQNLKIKRGGRIMMLNINNISL